MVLCDHWTRAEAKMLETADTFDGLADIALAILGRMRELKEPIVEICGPISTGGFNDIAENMALFEHAIERATDAGLVVFNQMPFQDAMIRISDWKPGVPYRMAILEVFYRRIFESGHISKALFLPDWESSHGARWERETLVRLGIPVEDYPVEWLRAGRITGKLT